MSCLLLGSIPPFFLNIANQYAKSQFQFFSHFFNIHILIAEFVDVLKPFHMQDGKPHVVHDHLVSVV